VSDGCYEYAVRDDRRARVRDHSVGAKWDGNGGADEHYEHTVHGGLDAGHAGRIGHNEHAIRDGQGAGVRMAGVAEYIRTLGVTEHIGTAGAAG